MNEKLVYYKIIISPSEYERWHDKILTNQSLAPEIIGMVLGRAKPVFIKDKAEDKAEDRSKNTWIEQMQAIGH